MHTHNGPVTHKTHAKGICVDVRAGAKIFSPSFPLSRVRDGDEPWEYKRTDIYTKLFRLCVGGLFCLWILPGLIRSRCSIVYDEKSLHCGKNLEKFTKCRLIINLKNSVSPPENLIYGYVVGYIYFFACIRYLLI